MDTSAAILAQHLGAYTRSGDDIVFDCLFCIKRGHASIKNKLRVNLSNGKFHCYRCGVKGPNLNYLMFLVTGDRNAYKPDILRTRKILTSVKDTLSTTSKYDLGIMEAELEEDFIPLCLSTSSSSSAPKRYLYSRGWNDTDIEFYNVHYGYNGKYKDMIVFPVYLEGVFVFYIGRSYVSSLKMYPNQSFAPVGKSGCMWNYDEAKKNDTIVLAEGVFDAYACGRNAVALHGKAISKRQINLLASSKAKEIVVCLDSDAKKEASDIAAKISPYKSCRILYLASGDPSDQRESIRDMLKKDTVKSGIKSKVVARLSNSKDKS